MIKKPFPLCYALEKAFVIFCPRPTRFILFWGTLFYPPQQSLFARSALLSRLRDASPIFSRSLPFSPHILRVYNRPRLDCPACSFSAFLHDPWLSLTPRQTEKTRNIKGFRGSSEIQEGKGIRVGTEADRARAASRLVAALRPFKLQKGLTPAADCF